MSFHTPPHKVGFGGQPVAASSPDFTYVKQGSNVILTPITDAARSWAKANLEDSELFETTARQGSGYVIPPTESFADILDEIDTDGLKVA